MVRTLIITEQQYIQIHQQFILSEKKQPKKNKNMSAGVLPIAKSTGRILIHKRGPKINNPNQWCNYGGGSRVGESQKQAAKREFEEESGYSGYVELIRSLKHKRGDFTFQNFIGIVDREFKPKINIETVDGVVEASDYRWLTFDELKKFRGNFHKEFKRFLDEKEDQILDIIKNKTKAK